MKAIIEFDLDNPDDEIKHLRCVKATDMAIVLHYITNNLQRNMNRAYDSGSSEKPEMEDVFKEIDDMLVEYDINISSLIL